VKPRGVVVGIHGFADHGAWYRHVGVHLASNGYSFWIYDLRGYGMTARRSGDEGYVEDFEEFVEDTDSFIDFVVDEEGVDDVYVLGHGVGGLIAVYYAGYLGIKRVRGLITSGAALLFKPSWRLAAAKVLARIAPRSRVSLPVNPRDLSNDPEIVRRYLEDNLVVKRPTAKLLVEIVNAANSVWSFVDRISAPSLVMHGSEDRVVPPEASMALYRRLAARDKTLRLYRGMKHELLVGIDRARVLNDVVKWLNKHSTT